MPDLPKPTAEGPFTKTPLPNVLLYARERKMSGSFVVTIEPADPVMRDNLDVAGESILVVEGGAIVAVRLPRTVDTLSWVLRDLGMITDETFNAVQEAMARPGTEEIPTLLRLRACDPARLDKALREQTRRKVLALFGFTEGSYRYYAKLDLLHGADRVRTPEDIMPIVWRGMVAHPPDPALMSDVVDKIGTRALKLREPNEFDRFEFGDELGLAPTQLRMAPSSLDQLMGLGKEPELVRSMVYILALTKQLEVVALPTAAVAEPARPVSAPAPPVPAAPTAEAAQATAAAQTEANDIEARSARAQLGRMERQTYYEMFELAEGATPDEIRAAFPTVVAKWHPDRAKRNDLRALYTEIFAHFNTAFGTLSDAKSRLHYDESIHGGGGTPEAQKKVAAVLDTVQDVQRAEVALKRKDFTEAERLLRKALATSPDDVGIMLMLAQCLFEKDPVVHYDEAQELLVKVISTTENSDHAHFLMGLLLKSKNDQKRAYRFFKVALEHNPNHVGAQREVILLERRNRERREAAAGPIAGFFNKFKPKK